MQQGHIWDFDKIEFSVDLDTLDNTINILLYKDLVQVLSQSNLIFMKKKQYI